MVLCAPRVYSQTASRSGHPFWQGSRSRPKDTDTHTGKSRCICSNSPHLLPCIAMWPNYGFQTVIWLCVLIFCRMQSVPSLRVVRCQCAHGPQLSVHTDWSDACWLLKHFTCLCDVQPAGRLLFVLSPCCLLSEMSDACTCAMSQVF